MYVVNLDLKLSRMISSREIQYLSCLIFPFDSCFDCCPHDKNASVKILSFWSKVSGGPSAKPNRVQSLLCGPRHSGLLSRTSDPCSSLCTIRKWKQRTTEWKTIRWISFKAGKTEVNSLYRSFAVFQLIDLRPWKSQILHWGVKYIPKGLPNPLNTTFNH